MRKAVKKENRGPERPESLYADILANTDTGLYVYCLEDRADPASLRMTDANPAGARLVGMKRSAMVGKRILDIFPGLGKMGIHKKYREVVIKQKPLRISDFLYGQPGLKPAWYSFNAFPLPGDCVGILFEDITRAKNAETALAQARLELEQVLNTVGSPVFVKDRSHKWIMLNDAYCRFMGYPRARLIGRSDHDFFPKEQADIFHSKDEEVFRTGRENVNEEKFTDSKGVEHAIITTKRLFTGHDGRPFLVGVINDITEIRRTGRQLALFRNLMERSTDGFFIVDPATGAILDVNATACENLGYSKKRLLSMKVWDVWGEGEDPGSFEKFARKVREKGALLFESRDRRRDGSFFPVEVSVTAVSHEGREYFLAVVRDISERRKMEEAIREVKTLQDLIPICASCKKIRSDKGYWEQVESYFERRSDAKFTHGLCETCAHKLYGHEDWYKEMKR
ncbi:MAG: PAS domain S-box protein [Elusimicrobiales bacterium]|nr:PAS domain S-box protein [Elusimicrobiales bacterium]